MWRSARDRWRRWLRGSTEIPTWRDAARKRGLVPVMDLDWETLYAIDAEGRVFASTDPDWREIREEEDPGVRHLVLAQAALRDPATAHLRPVRKPDDPDCAGCGGTGTRAGSARICECGGLGWLPSETAREHG